jgi:hypothetical protein
VDVRPRLRSWLAPLGVLSAITATASCLLTSNFDGLTGNHPTSSGSSMATAGGGVGGSSASGLGGATGSTTTGSGGNTTAVTTGSGGMGVGGGGCVAKNIGGAFPATCVLDDFNRADGDPGINWLIETAGNYDVMGQQLTTPAPSMMGQSVTPGTALWSDVLGPTQEVFVTLASFTPADYELELLLKAQAGPVECGSLQVSYHQGTLDVSKCELSDHLYIALPPGSMMVTFAPGDQLGARATAAGVLTVYKNGQKLGTWDATGFSGYAASGRIGIESDGAKDALAYDDFGGGGQ